LLEKKLLDKIQIGILAGVSAIFFNDSYFEISVVVNVLREKDKKYRYCCVETEFIDVLVSIEIQKLVEHTSGDE